MVLCQQNYQPKGGRRDSAVTCPRWLYQMWSPCGGRLSWLRAPETCPLVVKHKLSGLPLMKLCENLAMTKKKSPVFIISI